MCPAGSSTTVRFTTPTHNSELHKHSSELHNAKDDVGIFVLFFATGLFMVFMDVIMKRNMKGKPIDL